MKITSAIFLKGVRGTDEVLENGIPQVAVIGRSNVGKSSLINSLTGHKKLARTSSHPGRTREINIFLINQSWYLMDLPGYGYAKASKEDREWTHKCINWYLFTSGYEQKKVVLIIDALIGPTNDDLDILRTLEEHQKDVVVVANKIDKLKPSAVGARLALMRTQVGEHRLIPYSSKKKIGILELALAIAP